MQKIWKILFPVFISLFFFLVVMGCAKFEPQPISSKQIPANFESHKIDNQKPKEFSKAKPEMIGLSVQDHVIKAFFWGRAKIYVYIIGVIHGNERNSSQLVEQIWKLLEQNHDPKNSRITFIMIPCLNPDGMYSNRRSNANSVDLNRNFPFWDFDDQSKCNRYRKSLKILQPEIQALLQSCRIYPPSLIYCIHQPLNLINFDGPAKTIALDIQHINGMKIKSDIGYATPGSLGTYFGRVKHIPVITLELPNKRKNKDWEYILHTNAEAIIFSAHRWEAHRSN